MVKTFNNFTAKKTSHYSKLDLNTEAAAFYHAHGYCMLTIGNHRHFKTCEMVIKAFMEKS